MMRLLGRSSMTPSSNGIIDDWKGAELACSPKSCSNAFGAASIPAPLLRLLNCVYSALCAKCLDNSAPACSRSSFHGGKLDGTLLVSLAVVYFFLCKQHTWGIGGRRSGSGVRFKSGEVPIYYLASCQYKLDSGHERAHLIRPVLVY